ncbi:hypothetical protein JVT61DRAFT_8180 [Boletus reticuloceps]|uniref:Uncharacterized protein n=1 Tax=Boletus reticuloceps TaxID=495285 RepID=A0A8I2YWT3_9AGAM|nr:hypothetical protein JVT61DRAFT_8180 [Boletus reticuloceps]
MATSRMSLDPPPSLIDLPPLVNPHALPNHHVIIPDLAPAAHTLARRVSSDSQAPGRASPSSRISRRTPVPFLLEAFPAPPSHIPGAPTSLTSGSLLNSGSLLTSATGWLASTSAGSAVSTGPISSNSNTVSPCSPKSVVATLLPQSNPPPSLPPTGPLPPIPGPSSVTPDVFPTHRALQTVARSASPALSTLESQRSQSRSGQRPRLSIDVNNPIRGRGRQGSLSSLRNPIYPMGEQSKVIAESSCPPPPPPSVISRSPPVFGSVAERRSHDQSRGDSLDIPRSCVSRVAATPLARTDDKLYVEDSLANVDMSDLNAVKMDNEGDGDDQASRPFPRFPPLLHSKSQSPIDSPSSVPSYVHTPRKPSSLLHGAISPEVTQMISATPRLRKGSVPSRSREPSSTRNRKESSRSRSGADTVQAPTSSHKVKNSLVTKAARLNGGGKGICAAGGEEGNESDSSLDLHTPLPELMLRHGMLSPNSKLLPQPEVDPTRLSIMSGLSSFSNGSNLSLMSTTSTCSKHPKDVRYTPQRRVRHRDGKTLMGGIGLTTGLGWSDSEDEDAPSQLTRRVSSLVLSRRASSSSVASCRSSHSQSSSPNPLSRSISHTILREIDEHEHEHEHDHDELGHSHRVGLASRSLPSRSKPVGRVGSGRSTGSSTGRYSTHSTSSVGIRARGGSISESSVYAASLASKPDSSDAHTSAGLMPGIREQDDGVTPTRAAFERSSLGSLNGGPGVDIPHTPSSTASSASLPFPVTPESGTDVLQLKPPYNHNKVLPPLPPSVKAKYPSTLGLRSRSGGLQRPRASSNSSSVSNSSMLSVPSEAKPISASQASTPRQSLAERPTKTAFPPGSSRPYLNATPRPSLTIPKSPLQSTTSGLPRPTTPSSPHANVGQGYTPRPLRLVSRSSPLPFSTSSANVPSNPLPNQPELNQSPPKPLQPGEQSPRPGQVLTYNRNVHDQLKSRTLSLNSGPHCPQTPALSPGSTQSLFMPSPAAGSDPNSALSTPVTARSQSPLPSPGIGGEGMRPKPRTGTGMIYRTNLSVGSVAASKIRIPSTVLR